MSQSVLEKYRDIQVINDEETLNKMLAILVELPKEELMKRYVHSPRSGRCYVLRHDDFPGYVLEYVPDIQNDSSVSTLYAEHRIFQSKQSLIDAREEIIAALDSHFMAIPNTVTVRDEGRNKEVFFPELGTAQLIDALAMFTSKRIHRG